MAKNTPKNMTKNATKGTTKKDTGLKATLSLGAKVPVKKSNVDVEKTDSLTKKIHATPSKKEGKWVRLTTDLPEEEYKQFKKKLIDEGLSRKGQDIVRELIRSYIANT